MALDGLLIAQIGDLFQAELAAFETEGFKREDLLHSQDCGGDDDDDQSH